MKKVIIPEKIKTNFNKLEIFGHDFQLYKKINKE